MKPSPLLLFSLSILLLLGCSQTPNANEDPAATDSIQYDNTSEPSPKPKPNVGQLRIVETEKVPTKTDAFGLIQATIAKDTLKAKVEYGGGCEKHIFTLYWNGQFNEEDPPSIELFFHHNANNDECEALIMKDVTFDLKPLKEIYLKAYPEQEKVVLTLQHSGLWKVIEYRFTP
jgi:hypothetical protein